MCTILIRILIIVLVLFTACSRRENSYSKIIHQANKIQIKKISGSFDTTMVMDKDLPGLFEEVLRNDEGNCSCQAKEEIVFYKDNIMLLKVGVAQYDKDCVFLITNSGDKRVCYRLNYRLGMFLSEL